VVLPRTTQGDDVRCLPFLAIRSLEENILQVSDAFVPATEHIISRTTVSGAACLSSFLDAMIYCT
jgi:hypothetical protein